MADLGVCSTKADDKLSALQDMVENLRLEKEIAEADLEEVKVSGLGFESGCV